MTSLRRQLADDRALEDAVAMLWFPIVGIAVVLLVFVLAATAVLVQSSQVTAFSLDEAIARIPLRSLSSDATATALQALAALNRNASPPTTCTLTNLAIEPVSGLPRSAAQAIYVAVQCRTALVPEAATASAEAVDDVAS